VQYPGALLFTDVIDVLAPVLDPSSTVIGVVRVTYHITNVAEVLSQTRLVILVVLLAALVSGVLLGLLLAINLEKPIKKVTSAIYDLAQGGQREPVVEEGPLEIRAQIRAINYLVGRLSSLEQSRRQLLANLVHELGRPLGALLSAIQALSKGAAHDPKLLNDLTTGMEEEVTKLQHVLDDLAHLHDQVLGTLELNLQPVALSEWLPRVLLPLQQAAREKHLDWQVEIPEGLPTLGLDPVRMGQVVGNLASNAIKYTQPGGSVTITAGTQDNQAWICFADSGVGIVQEEQEKVFQPFFRGTQGRRIKQGMGLGLTIARDLVAAHGGHIDLESKPGEGSRFTVWLPIVRTLPLE
jgi:two-component system sensor histidine kinase BaeS